MAKVDCEINGNACSVEDGVWTSKDKKFAKVLNSIEKLLADRRIDQDPNPDAAAARHMIKELGTGKIVSAPKAEESEDSPAGRVY